MLFELEAVKRHDGKKPRRSSAHPEKNLPFVPLLSAGAQRLQHYSPFTGAATPLFSSFSEQEFTKSGYISSLAGQSGFLILFKIDSFFIIPRNKTEKCDSSRLVRILIKDIGCARDLDGCVAGETGMGGNLCREGAPSALVDRQRGRFGRGTTAAGSGRD